MELPQQDVQLAQQGVRLGQQTVHLGQQTVELAKQNGQATQELKDLFAGWAAKQEKQLASMAEILASVQQLPAAQLLAGSPRSGAPRCGQWLVAAGMH